MTELKPEQPSRFHKYSWRKGGMWVLNQQHPHLKSTATCKIDGTVYCAYCAERARPIQSRLGTDAYDDDWDDVYDNWRHEITGHTCDCDKARNERKLRDEEAEFNKKVFIERQELRSRYDLEINTRTLLAIKHEKEKKRVESGWSVKGLDILNQFGKK